MLCSVPMLNRFAPDTVAALVQVMGKAGDADRTPGRALAIGLEDVADHVDRLGIILQLLAVPCRAPAARCRCEKPIGGVCRSRSR